MRDALASCLAMAVLVTIAAAAEAHAFLEHAIPRVGGTVSTGPAELRLQFSEAIELPFCRVDLATQDGEKIETGPLSTDPDDERQLVLAVRRELVPGFYRVSWRVVSRDTHVTQGEYTFEVRP
jgi:copper resistance protein C